jgi:hypothetical protein
MRRTLAPAVVACLACSWLCVAGCAPSPRQRPVKMGPVDAGAGSLEAARRDLEGTWVLQTLEIVNPSGGFESVKASGTLAYDAYSNLQINGKIDDPRLQKSIPLDFNGRVVIDPSKREFYPADIEAGPKVDTAKLAPIGLDKVRKFEIAGDRLVVTYQDASGKPTAKTTWRRRAA